MQNKKKVMAVGAAALVGIAGYGVYATTLNISSTNAFSAGTGAQDDGCIKDMTTTFVPVLENGQWVTPSVHLGGEFGACSYGSVITVTGLNADNTAVATGKIEVNEEGNKNGYDVKLENPETGEQVLSSVDIANWGILVNSQTAKS